MLLEPGSVIDGRYEVEALIGQGGLAEVFRVRHLELGSLHALKVLLWRRKSLTERLILEGRIQAQLRHPNIVAVTDLIRVEGRVGLLMEYIDHQTLDDLLDERRLGHSEALALLAPVFAAVIAAHDAGVLHRDLKPANILLARSGATIIPKVADFGIAKVVADEQARSGNTAAGVAMGTPGYLAPEQVTDAARIDARADVFALGAIAYECIAGWQAFAGDDGTLDVHNTVQLTPRALDAATGCPASTWAAIERALAKRPEERFPDLRSFARALFAEHPALLEQIGGPDGPRALTLGGSTPPPAQPARRAPPSVETMADFGLPADAPPVDPALPASSEVSQTPTPHSHPGRAPRPSGRQVATLTALGGALFIGAFGVVTTGGMLWVGSAPRASVATIEAHPVDVPSAPEPLEPTEATTPAAEQRDAPTTDDAAGTADATGPADAADTTDAAAAGARPKPPPPTDATASGATASSAASAPPRPPPPAPTPITGAWSGVANEQAFVLQLEGTDEALTGRVVFTIGGARRDRPVSGQRDGDRVSLAEGGPRGFVYEGQLGGDVLSGTYGKRSASARFPFRVTRD